MNTYHNLEHNGEEVSIEISWHVEKTQETYPYGNGTTTDYNTEYEALEFYVEDDRDQLATSLIEDPEKGSLASKVIELICDGEIRP